MWIDLTWDRVKLGERTKSTHRTLDSLPTIVHVTTNCPSSREELGDLLMINGDNFFQKILL